MNSMATSAVRLRSWPSQFAGLRRSARGLRLQGNSTSGENGMPTAFAAAPNLPKIEKQGAAGRRQKKQKKAPPVQPTTPAEGGLPRHDKGNFSSRRATRGQHAPGRTAADGRKRSGASATLPPTGTGGKNNHATKKKRAHAPVTEKTPATRPVVTPP